MTRQVMEDGYEKDDDEVVEKQEMKEEDVVKEEDYTLQLQL